MERYLSAPGKLFVSGEYAVLWGGVARLLAVGPRGEAYVVRRDDAQVHLVLEEGRLFGPITPLGVRWDRKVPEGFRFAARAVDEVLKVHAQETLGFTLVLSPSELVEGHKLGLGSSARACVLAAEAARYVLEERADPLKMALAAHFLAQGGRGSGADVATSFAGGFLRYRRFEVAPLVTAAGLGASALGRAPPVDLIRLRAPRHPLLYAFAGKGASTPVQVAQVEQRLDTAARARFVERSDALGQGLEAALAGTHFAAVAQAVEALSGLLAELDGVVTPAAERILALSKSHGCAAKVSGAGGGDGCIVFCPDDAARSALLAAFRDRRLHAHPVTPEAGLRGEATGQPLLKAWSA